MFELIINVESAGGRSELRSCGKDTQTALVLVCIVYN
jgi:hypothetical protein